MGCIELISNIIFQYIVHHMMSLIFNHALWLLSRLDVHFKHTTTPLDSSDGVYLSEETPSRLNSFCLQ